MCLERDRSSHCIFDQPFVTARPHALRSPKSVLLVRDCRHVHLAHSIFAFILFWNLSVSLDQGNSRTDES